MDGAPNGTCMLPSYLPKGAQISRMPAGCVPKSHDSIIADATSLRCAWPMIIMSVAGEHSLWEWS